MGEVLSTLVQSDPIAVAGAYDAGAVRLELAGGNLVIYLPEPIAAKLCFDLLGAVNAGTLVEHLEANPDPEVTPLEAHLEHHPVTVLCGHKIMGDIYCRRSKGHEGFHTGPVWSGPLETEV